MGANVSFPDRPGPAMTGPGRTPNMHRPQTFLPDEGVARDKKKKSSKLATLRKKLARARRHSRSFDHARALRELTSSWPVRDLSALTEEYEALVALKELALGADLARPGASTYRQDLGQLYERKYCTDVDLVYQGSCFPVHRAILCARCAFFRSLLARYPDYASQVPIHIRTPGVDTAMFSALLRYLYTGEFLATDSKFQNYDILMQLGEEFGVPNLLERDIRTLLESSDYSDAILVFTSDSEGLDPLTPEGSYGDCRGARGSELRCHKAILAARSPFFRNLLLRRARSGEELTNHALRTPTRIVLDESVLPKQYARVLLHALYLDSVDLNHVIQQAGSTCSLSEVQAIVAGRGAMTQVDQAMEIYQIGQFLDFSILSQGCEDLIIEQLTVENLLPVLYWSSQPHGSSWCRRQALHFLREEFLQVAHSAVIYDLSREYLVEAVCSDFLQAGELDVLSAVLKWGEHQLIKRMEEREPNLLTHTAHSVSRKGIKKRDLSDLELREVLADILPLVRVDHVIPHNHDTLTNAIKRGLLSVPPSHMMGDEGAYSRMSAWIRGKSHGMFVRPRLFMPFYEEAKSLLEEQLSQVQENEVVRLRLVHMSAIPDTLYMLEDRGPPPMSPCPANTLPTIDTSGTILVPDLATLKAMQCREHALQHTKAFQRAYNHPAAERRAVARQVALRVVREFGLPDTTADVLLGSRRGQGGGEPCQGATSAEGRYRTPARRRPRHPQMHSPSLPVSPTRSYSPVEKEPSTCSDSVLSEMMPDIAMATASMTQMSLDNLTLASHGGGDLELDLGDGTNHSGGGGGGGTLYI